MGSFHAEQPMLGKVGVRPTIPRRFSTVVVISAMTLEQDSPQPTSNPFVGVLLHDDSHRGLPGHPLAATRGISRVPCEVFPGVLGVSDRAECGPRLAITTSIGMAFHIG